MCVIIYNRDNYPNDKFLSGKELVFGTEANIWEL